MVVALLYEMQMPCNCFTLYYALAIVGETITALRWRSKAQDDDGHIMSHILIACDVYLLCILFCLVRW